MPLTFPRIQFKRPDTLTIIFWSWLTLIALTVFVPSPIQPWMRFNAWKFMILPLFVATALSIVYWVSLVVKAIARSFRRKEKLQRMEY